LHLGYHDPSGLDMIRDIEQRLALWDVGVEVRRIALNLEQLKQYKPPLNFAKLMACRLHS
ncbi:MAG: hypothetical protein ACYSQZ_07860, partial [Planctomycetota bacterium]